MARFRNNILSFLLAAVGILTANTLCAQTEEADPISFRGAWIATVANIDWPTPEAVGQPDFVFVD